VTARIAAALALVTLACGPRAASGASLRFHGNGVNDIDRVKIRVDDPLTDLPGPPADVGATDFTIEFWMRARAADNSAPPVACGANIDWIYGNILLDRDRYNQDRKFGLSIAGGRVVFGVSGDGAGDRTICGATGVLDDAWHHVAVQRRRSDGWMWLYVDGVLQSQANGPDGDISYPDDGVPGNFCGGPCVNSDPFLVFGAEKHDAGSAFPSYSGWLDEVRLSTTLRYSANFTPSATPLVPDGLTAALYHLDEGAGDVIGDTSGASGGPSDGERRFGGSPAGPEWSSDTPFGVTAASTRPVRAPALTAQPNPFRERVTIHAASGERLDVVDVAGRVVVRLAGRRTRGGFAFEWARTAQPPGLYIARTEHGSVRIVAR
jgi:hypothetical protein